MSHPPCLSKALAGDRAALEELAAFCHPAVFRYLARLTGSRDYAADLAQDTMVRMLESLDTWRPRPGAGFLPWVFRIARNRFIDSTRRRVDAALENGDNGRQPSGGADDTSIAALANIDSDELRRALTRLPPEDRELLELRYFFGFSHREAAQILGVKPPVVKSRLCTALSRLRKQYTRLEKKGSIHAKAIHETIGD